MKKTWNRESSIFHIFSILIPFEMQQWRRLFDNIALEIWRVCRSKCLYIRSYCFIVCWSGCLECESVVVFLFHSQNTFVWNMSVTPHFVVYICALLQQMTDYTIYQKVTMETTLCVHQVTRVVNVQRLAKTTNL